MMKKLFLILCLLPMLQAAMGQKEELTAILGKLTEQTLNSDVSVTISERNQPFTYNGKIKMRGEKFFVEIMSMQIAYDGQTLYTFSEDTEEITLSTPTMEELQEVNPLLYAKALIDVCEVTKRVAGDKTVYTLNPHTDAVQHFTLTIRTADQMPLEAVMKESAQKQTSLKLLNPQYSDSSPAFVIEKAGVSINDLR